MGVDDYNSVAQRALKRAQEARGVRSAEAFAKLLAARTGGAPSSSTYHRWLRGESPIPAWVLLAAAEEADSSLGALMTPAELPRLAYDRLGQVEDLIGLLQAQMMEVRETLGLPLSLKQADQPENAPSGRRRQHG